MVRTPPSFVLVSSGESGRVVLIGGTNWHDLCRAGDGVSPALLILADFFEDLLAVLDDVLVDFAVGPEDDVFVVPVESVSFDDLVDDTINDAGECFLGHSSVLGECDRSMSYGVGSHPVNIRGRASNGGLGGVGDGQLCSRWVG